MFGTFFQSVVKPTLVGVRWQVQWIVQEVQVFPTMVILSSSNWNLICEVVFKVLNDVILSTAGTTLRQLALPLIPTLQSVITIDLRLFLALTPSGLPGQWRSTRLPLAHSRFWLRFREKFLLLLRLVLSVLRLFLFLILVVIRAEVLLNLDLRRIFLAGFGSNLLMRREKVLRVTSRDQSQIHQVYAHKFSFRNVTFLDLVSLDHFLEKHLIAADGLFLLVNPDILLPELMQETLYTIVVLVLNHLPPGTLNLPFELLASNVILLDLRLEDLSWDPGVIEHVREDIFEILNAHTLHPAHYIGDINFNQFGFLLSYGIFVLHARWAPSLRLDRLSRRRLRVLILMRNWWGRPRVAA